jgi:tetratricopeptide (TPR) repeat protein
MNNVFLVENHDEVLGIWRKQNIKALDVVHLDAHIDFGFYAAEPIEKVLSEAKSVKELKRKLEHTLNFLHYQKDFNQQANIGNYIYPAIGEGIVKNFYWVVPARAKVFKKATKIIKNILKGNLKQNKSEKIILAEDSRDRIIAKCLGRNFVVCTLDNLPVIAGSVLLDIDTDFLTTDSVLNADNIKNIGKRKPWILPNNLVEILKAKIKAPKIITIAYSVNGGWTPLKYKHLGDELAYGFAPVKFRAHLQKYSQAARHFNLFETTGKQEYYRKATRLNPTYRIADNNYGPLYLALRKFSLAQKEFRRILNVDRKNPAAQTGLGIIALEKKDFTKAKRYFTSALKFLGKNGLFKGLKPQILFNLGKTEFNLHHFKRAKELLLRYRAQYPLHPQSHYLLGRIFEKERKFAEAAVSYQDALRLGMNRIELLLRLLRITVYIKNKNDIIKYIITKNQSFKKELARLARLNLKKKKIKGLAALKKKIFRLEKQLADFPKN